MLKHSRNISTRDFPAFVFDWIVPCIALRSKLMYKWIALNGRNAVDVLDEQDFVADLVIEELVDGASREEKTETAGW